MMDFMSTELVLDFGQNKMNTIKVRAWNRSRHQMYYDVQNWYDSPPEFYGGFSTVLNGNYDVMLFTGLKDKNDKEIYEGDIVWYRLKRKYSDYQQWGDSFKRVIEWKKGKTFTGFNLTETGVKNMEVVGNIFENPGLLKEYDLKKIKT